MQMNNATACDMTANKQTRPIFSPRTQLSNHIKELQTLKDNLIINIDKFILGNLKTEFERRKRQLTHAEFMFFCNKFLKDWNPGLEGRSVKVNQCLISLWNEIDIESKGVVTWEEFNSKIIETSLNLKTLSNTSGIQAPIFREKVSPIASTKYEGSVAKMCFIENEEKVAYFREQSTRVQFFSTCETKKSQSQLSKMGLEKSVFSNDTGSQEVTKPIMLPQQDLKVETMIKIKNKDKNDNKTPMERKTNPSSSRQVIKKDIVFSSYKNTVLDILFLNDKKYHMLLVSCSDKYIRGYDVSGSMPTIAMQPQNQDETMIHQFPVQIYTMTWDSVNEVLYAAGKNLRIYQWMVKIDSERELYDAQQGHHKMILTMLMMPKLQLLSTGGFDGKMILWDTVSQSVKCRYEEHTRAISSITFHEALILLFTASYDHKICVWNPYISSLIHKIDNSLNILSLQVIPNTNYLLSLDAAGNVRVREMSKFTQIVSFCIFHNTDSQEMENYVSNQSQHESGICVCSTTKGPLKYYFGTEKVYQFEYIQVEKSTLDGTMANEYEYFSRDFRLYVPIKNNIIVHDLLIGRIHETLYDLMETEITSIAFFEELNLMILGDLSGAVSLFKIRNGVLIKQIYRFRNSTLRIKAQILRHGEKENNVKKTYMIICASEEGEIVVFRRFSKGEFELYKSCSLKRDFGLGSPSVLTFIEYMSSKNILVVMTHQQEFLFIDVEKKSLLTKSSLGSAETTSIRLFTQKNLMLTVTKNAQIVGMFLPPSSRKYKKSCVLNLDDVEDIEHSLISCGEDKVYIATKYKQLLCFSLDQSLFESYRESEKANNSNSNNKTMFSAWRSKIPERVRKMSFIQNEQILILLTIDGMVHFFSSSDGQSISSLKTDQNTVIGSEPIFYLNSEGSAYFPEDQTTQNIEFGKSSKQAVQIEKVADPDFFKDKFKEAHSKYFNRVTKSSDWNLYLSFKDSVKEQILSLKKITKTMKKGLCYLDSLSVSEADNKRSQAVQLQKKWEKQKESYDQEGKLVIQKEPKQEETLKESRRLNRGASMGVISMWSQKVRNAKKKETIASIYHEKRRKTAHNDSHSNQKNIESDPMFRLGNALKSINSSDTKAHNFIRMAEQKQSASVSLKLPKLPASKLSVYKN